MAELADFPSASAKDTVAFCWAQVEGQKRPLITSWVVMVLAVVVADIVCPLIFAAILGRVADAPAPPRDERMAPLRPAPARLRHRRDRGDGVLAGRGLARVGRLRARLRPTLNNGYRHLLRLSYRWHMDHPAGEVISSLGNFSWAFVEMVDVASWGLLPVAVIVLSAIVVLAVVAWPRRPGPAGHGRRLRLRAVPAPAPGARGLPGVRGPPLQGDRRGRRHGHQPDGGADRRGRAPGAGPGRATSCTSRSTPTCGPARSSCGPSSSWRPRSSSAPCSP